HRERQRAAHGELPAHRRAHLVPADRPAHRLDLAEQVEHLTRPNDALEPHVVDAGEERELATVLGLREHGDGTTLRQRLDHLHPRHDRVAGKMTSAVAVRDRLARDDALTGDELEHLVDEQEGIAVREDLLDLPPAEGRRHVLTLVAMELTPDVVVPRLRGGFGRPYYHATETASTQRLAPGDAPHGAVALAEHQTEGRGRLGRVWLDDPGTGLTFSVVLRPPPPVAEWPALTLVAAAAVAAAIGEGASIKEPNDVLVGGRKAAGILAEAADERVVLGIGVNVGAAPWPDAGVVDADRLELLVEILAQLERGYERWLRDR